MKHELIFKVALQNLKRTLETLLDTGDAATKHAVRSAIAYTSDLENCASTFIGDVAKSSDLQSTTDSTNYKLYELLTSFGLNEEQLLLVSRSEALHQLRQLRMLRIVYGYSLTQAQAALQKFEEGNDRPT